VSEVDELLAEHHDAEIAKILIERGRRPGGGGTFDATRIAFIRTTYELKSYRERLLERGSLSRGSRPSSRTRSSSFSGLTSLG
jgi:hypothetical protein